MVEQMDTAIGRLLETIRECGLENETAVVFLSDNGPQYMGTERVSPEEYAMRYASGLRGHKGSLLENGIRVPMVARIPGIPPGKVFSRVASVHDLLPTFIELFGLRLPARALPMDGRSLLPQLQNNEQEGGDGRFFTASNIGWPPVKEGNSFNDWHKLQYSPVDDERPVFAEEMTALRSGDYKLIRSLELEPETGTGATPEALFNVRIDPSESENLSKNQPGRSEQLREEMQNLYESIREEPHAWHNPVFTIRSAPIPDAEEILAKRNTADFWNLDWSLGGGIVPLNSPVRRLGSAWNADHFLFHVNEPGDGGEYNISVEESGDYSVIFRGRDFGGEAVPVRLEVSGGGVLDAGIGANHVLLGKLKLPRGNALLRVTRRGAGGPDGTRWGDLFIFKQP
jgi:uncharacterized sulfatase